jgi:hypothetical protein
MHQKMIVVQDLAFQAGSRFHSGAIPTMIGHGLSTVAAGNGLPP